LLALEQSEAMSRERMRIAQDMHDEIGSKLARISYLSEGVKTELKGVYANLGVVDSLAKTSRDLLRSLDQMVWAVNPRNDTVEQLVVYLGQYATDYFQNTAILCELRVPRDLPAAPVSAEVRHNLFLAFEEALTNAMKHSGAHRLLVELTLDPGVLQIAVADNGRGFNAESPVLAANAKSVRARHGISGLKRRLQSLGGECRIQSAPGQGTTVLFRIPIGVPSGPL
jgi:signal transduction histidine kinase